MEVLGQHYQRRKGCELVRFLAPSPDHLQSQSLTVKPRARMVRGVAVGCNKTRNPRKSRAGSETPSLHSFVMEVKRANHLRRWYMSGIGGVISLVHADVNFSFKA